MKKIASLARAMVVAAGLLSVSACTNLDDLQQKMLSGGATGAIAGTVGVALTGGCIPCGTAIGGAAGTAAGYLMDQLDKATKSDPTPGSGSGYGASAPVTSGASGYSGSSGYYSK